MIVGTIVELKLALLGNSPGAHGVIYETYKDLDGAEDPGVSVIFENGNYDGFSVAEQKEMLKELVVFTPLENYQFRNVLQLSRDFNNGVFRQALSLKVGHAPNPGFDKISFK